MFAHTTNMDVCAMNVENNLQDYRWSKGWSQEQLARQSGVAKNVIGKIENGITRNPSVGTALLLAHALDTSVEEIFKVQ